MNEATKEVIKRFVELLKKYPNGDIFFLWVQAGGSISDRDDSQ